MERNNLPPFYVGQKVVCINEKGWVEVFPFKEVVCDGPKLNEICTIRDFDQSGYLLLVGYPGGFDDGFYPAAFVPFEQNFQSISYEKVLENEQQLISSN